MDSVVPYIRMDTMPRITVDVDDSTLWTAYKVKLARLGKTSQEVLLSFIRRWAKERKEK